MAEAGDRKATEVGEDEKDDKEIDIREATDICNISVTDGSPNSDLGDTQDSEGNEKNGSENGVVTVSENSELPPEIPPQIRTPCKEEPTAQKTGDASKDLTSGCGCQSKESSQTREENKENCDIPIISALAMADTIAIPKTEEHLKQSDSSPEVVTSLKNAANAAATEVARREGEEGTRKAAENGCVSVVFPGTVTQDGCCRFVCEILKCVLYQRQQLPMTYDQLVHFQKRQQAASLSEDVCGRRPAVQPSGGWDGRKCQRTLVELEEVLQQLEALFSLSMVPRVLLLLGGSTVLPKELYEINMEALCSGSIDGSLRASACLRQLFRALFVADILSDARPVRLMATTVMALGHRDCGVAWFRPKLDYRVPTRVKRHVIALSSDPSLTGVPQGGPEIWADYVWFQAPVTIKGFCK
ncbi:hypothetical protein AGOR_G00213220 [Albula goreensis]|uniref:MAD2L1-binding protein n=1 Tax=Albula goreensis TaxID=1534307 RepID=A0A8T3CRC7_9TELE|nr:hypothetical protein AGOR_G00213220 [Albula goreensis]